ncbi:MAG TPA: L,D-transpeptidase family protein [Ferruginibacter sp.]|jgi:murein L,D-transpeptidase YafK|nr:L,D-transpeptidase family protein [Ferruginibacter sp.]
MNLRFIKKILLIGFAIVANHAVMAQTSFTSAQKYTIRIPYPLAPITDTLEKQFAAKKLKFPPLEMYVRSFKLDRKLEVWIKDSARGTYKLFKTYKVCMESGVLGPKRMEGDYQVPEGFYYIDEFNPNSNYHLALGLNYPNASDKILSDSLRPGGDIYIHGNRVSTGCIPIDDEPIEEVYVLASIVKSNGEDFIPVHVFPVKYDEKKSFDYLSKVSQYDQNLQKFALTLKEVFDYFQEKKQIPVILVNKKGDYVID